jgi:general secretion pathway protein G
MRRGQYRASFSLVELIIVVVIIGAVAAVAVPRISRGAKGAADASVRDHLAMLRNAIELYAAEHGGGFPAADRNPATFINQMTRRSDINGTIGQGSDFVFGPYLRSGLPPLPVGPNPGADDIHVADTGPTVDEQMTNVGWVYNCQTGQIIANTDETDETGLGYDMY